MLTDIFIFSEKKNQAFVKHVWLSNERATYAQSFNLKRDVTKIQYYSNGYCTQTIFLGNPISEIYTYKFDSLGRITNSETFETRDIFTNLVSRINSFYK